jgi:hypothetical protein
MTITVITQTAIASVSGLEETGVSLLDESKLRRNFANDRPHTLISFAEYTLHTGGMNDAEDTETAAHLR